MKLAELMDLDELRRLVAENYITARDHPSLPVPRRYERAAIDAVERCPGECIYLEPDAPPAVAGGPDDADIVDAEIVDP